MKIIGEHKDIKHFKDLIDHENSEIPSNKNINKEEEKNENENKEEKEKRKVIFFAVKNIYEYPHEIKNNKVQKKREGANKKRKEKKLVDYDDELTEEEEARLEEIIQKRKQIQ